MSSTSLPIPADYDYASMTKTDFQENEWLEFLATFYISGRNLDLDRAIDLFKDQGKAVGFSSVQKYWNSYLKDAVGEPRAIGSELMTEFTGLPSNHRNLRAGRWTADANGIRCLDRQGEVWACRHPIVPIERIVNVDTGFEQIRLAYKRGKAWNTSVIAPKSVLASPQKIIDLADRGISVTADNAKPLISYLQEMEDLNYSDLPVARSTARLGWITDTEFSPYSDDLTFDDTTGFSRQFKSIDQVGDFNAWIDMVKQLRRSSPIYKIMIGASIGSAFLEKMDVLPAFVHINTDVSSSGKTVALMVAASVWGNPEAGEYVQSFNSTTVAMERLAEFYNSMPLCLDELQQAKDTKGQTHFSVYKLAQGSGRARSTRVGGLAKTPTWANFILTTGESPLVEMSDGEGALARVINIELSAPLAEKEELRAVVQTVKTNYGHAGRHVIESFQEGVFTEKQLRIAYEAFSMQLNNFPDIQDKQAMSAAAILVGDMIASDLIFHDGGLLAKEIVPYLMKKSATSVGNRALEYFRGWMAQNSNRFIDYVPGGDDIVGEIYGQSDFDCTYIIGKVFDDAMRAGGFSPEAVLSNWKRQGIIRTGDRLRVQKKIGGKNVRCVCLLDELEDAPQELDTLDNYEL